MSNELSTTSDDAHSSGLHKRLDEAEVLHAVVLQLRKDLNEDDIAQPPADPEAFEALRAQVLLRLEAWQRTGSVAFSRAINRVDLNEGMVDRAMVRGGLSELAGHMVLRCLQKVLIRNRFAGLV
jgi:hypothetical protein